MTMPPFRLESDEMQVELLPDHGARLHRLRAFGFDLLRTPPNADQHASDPFFWGAYVMAPWCNRARPGPTTIAGRTVDLAPNFPDGSAIHGQVYGRRWEAGDDGWLSMGGGSDGWPWPYEVRLRPSLERSTLSLNLALTNRSDELMPAGLGLHPWFVRPLEVTLPASKVYRANTDSPPEPEPVDGTSLDLRSGKAPPGDTDATWTALQEPSVHLRWPGARLEADMRIHAAAACVAAAAPAEPDATPVEPQTHGPDGLRRLMNGEPDAMALLAPGEELSLGIQLEVRRSG
jgi:aldose 1-epimerase